MFDTMQLLDEETGLPIFQKDYRDLKDNTYRVHAYVTYKKNCPCRCSFCRNEKFSDDLKNSNVTSMRKTLKIFSPYIYSITFGGGEPLTFIDELIETVNKTYFLEGKRLSGSPKKYMITCGLQEQFLKRKNDIFFCFDNLYLTRQRVSDLDNQNAFNTNSQILTTEDLWSLGYKVTKKIEIVSTCYKNGGIDNAKEMIELIKWAAYIGSETVIFNDLQFDVTDPQYYKDHQISDKVFNATISYLKRHNFKRNIEVCFSGGYTIQMFEGSLKTENRLGNKYWLINVGFKQYHKPGTTLKKWKMANKRTFDLSIMPNGEVFTDWANNHSANNL